VQWPGQNPIGKLVDCCNKNPGVIVGVISECSVEHRASHDDAGILGSRRRSFPIGILAGHCTSCGGSLMMTAVLCIGAIKSQSKVAAIAEMIPIVER